MSQENYSEIGKKKNSISKLWFSINDTWQALAYGDMLFLCTNLLNESSGITYRKSVNYVSHIMIHKIVQVS